MFEKQKFLGEETYLEIARELGIPEQEVLKVLDEKRYEDRIQAETAEMSATGARGTPTSFVNGHYLRGAQPYEKFKAAVDQALAKGNLGKDSYPTDIPPPPPPPPERVGKIPAGDAPILGARDAPVTVVIYSEFQ